jgi:hypothetical protein
MSNQGQQQFKDTKVQTLKKVDLILDARAANELIEVNK